MPPSIIDHSTAGSVATVYAKPETTTESATAMVSDLRVPEVRPPSDSTSETGALENSTQLLDAADDESTMDAFLHDALLDEADWDALAGMTVAPATTLAPTTVSLDLGESKTNHAVVVPTSPPSSLLTRRRRRRALVWFRHDLRLHDNLALSAALQQPELEIIPVYIIHKPEKKQCGPVRFQFVLECVQDLKNSLREKGSDLIVLRGEAIDVLRMVIPAWGITDLFYEEFVMQYATARDQEVNRIAQAVNVNVHTFHGRTLFDMKAILKKNGGAVCTDFSKFVKIVQELPQPPLPVPTPATVPSMELSKAQLCSAIALFCSRYAAPIAADVFTGLKYASEPFSTPTLAEFGHAVPAVHSFLYGGETEALTKLEAYCANEERVGLFEKPRTSPACTETQSTTTLSAYLAFGCLSLREFFYRIMFIQLKFPGRQGPPPVTLDGQLMWRDFFYCFGVGVKNFDAQDDNPMCMQINWKLQDMPSTDSSKWTDATKTSMDQLQAWREGRTGYPWIDAVQRQIEQDGWAHHVARHAVACFLTRGDLYISWLRGAYFFQEKLIDLDWPINIGNWLWVSSSCFFHDYHQINSPSMYVQAWDPQGDFIRKWVPALKNMPARYIFEPWKAPLSVQRAAGCLIGKDYPFPIIDHPSAMKKCVQWLDGVHEHAHQHDGVLTPCCDRDGKHRCHLEQKKQALAAQHEQLGVAGGAGDGGRQPGARKRPRTG